MALAFIVLTQHTILTVNLLGWAIACASILYSAARGRSAAGRSLRDLLVGVVLSVGSWYSSRWGPAHAGDPGRYSAAMEGLELLWAASEVAFTPTNLLYAALGVVVGTFIGVLPGIGLVMAIALLLPLTYGLGPTQALIVFAGIYYYCYVRRALRPRSCSTPPAKSSSVMTAIEGNKMAKAGRVAQALATAAIGSFIAAPSAPCWWCCAPLPSPNRP